jgi:hypothetical protein
VALDGHLAVMHDRPMSSLGRCVFIGVIASGLLVAPVAAHGGAVTQKARWRITVRWTETRSWTGRRTGRRRSGPAGLTLRSAALRLVDGRLRFKHRPRTVKQKYVGKALDKDLEIPIAPTDALTT